ncbi:MAG: potassium channel family protein [Rhodothermales bacterium]
MPPALTINGTDLSIDELLNRFRAAASPEERKDLLGTLVERYEKAGDDTAEALREVFVHALQKAPGLTTEKAIVQFLAEKVEPEDLAALEWEVPSEVVDFCETLYAAPYSPRLARRAPRTDAAHGSRGDAHGPSASPEARTNGRPTGEMEKVFQLLQIAPATLATNEGEALRLRNRAYLHELRRTQRNRRTLYGYLLLQALLITVVFPLLFINAENGRLQEGIEEATGVNVESKERQYLSYSDGLYWSFITAGSIGYGDVTPKTGMGRAIAAILGIMGVVTAGVIAGLILTWVTPRKLS